MAKFDNDYLDRLLGVEQVNPTSGLTDPEVRKALEKYEKPNSTYREQFGDASQGRAYDPQHKNAVVYRGNDYAYKDAQSDAQGNLAFSTLNPLSTEAYYNWNMRVKSLMSLGAQVGTKSLQGAAFLGAALGETVNQFAGAVSGTNVGGFISNVADNDVVKMFADADDAVKDYFPVLKGNIFDESGFFRKAGTSEFWASDVVDGLAFAASSYLTGAAIAKGLQVGAKSAKLLGIGNRAQKAAVAANELGLPNVQRYISTVDFTTNVLANTAIESMFEAKDVRDSILSDPSLRAKYSEEEIEKIAAEKARDVFGLNMLFIAPSNLFELASLAGKGLKGANRITRKADNLVGMDNLGQYQKLNAKWYQKPAFQLGKAFVSNAASEGLYEENIQYLIQEVSKFNAHKGPGQSFGDALGNMVSNIAQGDLNSQINEEQMTAIGLGGLIGGGMQLSHVSPKLNKALGGDGGLIQNYQDKLKNRDNLYNSLVNKSGSVSALDIFERETPTKHTFTREPGSDQEEEKFFVEKEGTDKREVSARTWKALATNAGVDLEKGGEGTLALPVLEADGSPKINPAKLESLYTQQKRREELNNVYDALLENPEKNKYSIEVVKAAMIADLAFAHFDAGLGEQLKRKLETIMDADKDSLALAGVSGISSPLELDSAKQYVQELEKLYNSLEVGIVNTAKDQKRVQERKQVMFDRGARILTIDKLKNDLYKENERLFNEIKFSSEALTDVFEAEGVANAWEGLDKKNRGLVGNDLALYSEGSLQKRRAEVEETISAVEAMIDVIEKNETRKDKVEWKDLKSNLLKLRELEQSRKDLFEEWVNISSLYKGEEYFSKNYDGVSKKYDYITDDIDIKTATLQQYLNWEKTKLPALKLRGRLHQVNKEYLNKYIREVLGSGKSLMEVVDWAIANEVSLSEHHITMIREELAELQAAAEANQEAIEAAENELSIAEFTGLTDEEIQDLTDQVSSLRNENEAIKIGLGSHFDLSPVDLDETLRNLKNRNTFDNHTEKDFKVDLARTLLGFVDSTIAAYFNNDSYEDLEAIEESIDVVKALLSVFKARSDSKEFADFIDDLETYLEDLNEALEVVTDRRLNKFRREYIRVNALADEIVKTVSTEDINELVPQLKEAMAALEEDKTVRSQVEADKEERIRKPVSYNLFALLSVLANNDPLAANIQIKIDTLVEEFLANNLVYKFLADNPIYGNFKAAFEEAFRDNPIRALKGFLLEQSTSSAAMGSYGYDKGPDSSLGKYLAEGDVNEMIKSLEAGEVRPKESRISSAALLNIAYLLKSLEALELVKSVAENETSPSLFITQFEKDIKANEALFKADKQFTPASSIVQGLAIFQIYNRLKELFISNGTSRKFYNWTYFKGPAGAGKTNVVVRYLLNTLKISGKDVVTAGHNDHSALGIQQSIGSEKTFSKEKLIEQLSNKTIPETTKLIIIDEIGGFSQREVDQIATLLVANYPALPVVAMGDPNQVTSSVREGVAMEKGYVEKSMILQGIHNIFDVTPLFTRYRSDNPAIVNLQDSFLNRVTELTDAIGTANVSPAQITSTDKPLYGTYIEQTSSTLLPILFNAYAKNPNRTRAVIVNDAETQAQYKAQIEKNFPKSTIEVLTFVESQGRTIDEVYVHMPYNKSLFGSIVEYSQGLYTATSRGKQFVYLSSVKGGSNKVDEQLYDKTVSIKKQKDDNFSGILAYLSSAQTILSKLGISVTDTAPPKNAEQNEDEDEDEENEFEETSEQITRKSADELLGDLPTDSDEENKEQTKKATDPVDEADRIDELEEIEEGTPLDKDLSDIHTEKTEEEEVKEKKEITSDNTSEESNLLMEPSSNIYKPMTIAYKGEDRLVYEGLNAAIASNTPVEVTLMRTTTLENKKAVLFAHRPKANENIFVTFAVLATQELDQYDLTDIPEVVSTSLGNNVFEVNRLPDNYGKPFKVDLIKSRSIKYRYASGRRKFDIREVFDRWAKSLFNQPKNGNISLGNKEEVRNEVRIVVPKSSELQSGGKYSTLAKDKVIQAGHPFMLLKGALINRATATGKKLSAVMKDQAILLTPRFLNLKNKHHFDNFISPIQDYIKHIKELEALIAKHIIDKTQISKYKLGTPEFAILVNNLSNVYASLTIADYSLGKEAKLDPSDQNYGNLFTLFDPKIFTDVNSLLLKSAAQVDIDIHGEWVDREVKNKKGKGKEATETTSYIRRYHGTAQHAFDKIARANLWMNAGGKTIILRDSRPITYYDKSGNLKNEDIVGGRNLLGWNSANKESKVNPAFSDNVKGYLRQASERSAETGFNIDFTKGTRIIDRTTGRKVMTIDELEEIFGKGAFNEKGEHAGKRGSGLRVPISRRRFNNKTIDEIERGDVKLSDFFDDTFIQVEPNQIAVFESKQAGVKPTVKPTPVVEEEIEEDLWDDIPSFSEAPNSDIPTLYKRFLGISEAADRIIKERILPAKEAVIELRKIKSLEEFNAYVLTNPLLKVNPNSVPSIVKELERIGANNDVITYFTELNKYAEATKKLRADNFVYVTLTTSSVSDGLFVQGPDAVIANLNVNNITRSMNVLRHEFIHSVVYDLAKKNVPKFSSLFNKLKNSSEFRISLKHFGNKSIEEILLSNQYKNLSEETKMNEALTIFFTEVALGNIVLKETTLTKIQKWLNELLKSVGLENILGIDNSDVYLLAEGLALAFARGTTLNSTTVRPSKNISFSEAPTENEHYTPEGALGSDKLDKYFNGSLLMYEHAKRQVLGFIRRKYSYDFIERNFIIDELWGNPPLTFDEAISSLPEVMGKAVMGWRRRQAPKGATIEELKKIPLDAERTIANLLATNAGAREEIIRVLFPDAKLSEEEENERKDSPFDYLKEQDTIDQQRSVIRNVKQILSTIEYKDKKGNLQYVNYPTAYAILLRMVSGLSTEGSLEQQVKFLHRKMADIGRTPESLAILGFMTDLINGQLIEDSGKANNITFTSDEKLAYTANGQTYNATKARGENQQDFLRRVARELDLKGVTMKDVYQAYKIYRYRNLYAQITSSIRSMRKQTLFVGIREKIKGTYIYKYFASRESGSKASVVSIIQGHLLKLYTDDAKVFSAAHWAKFTTERVKNPSNPETEAKRVKDTLSQFFTALGYNPRIRLAELMEAGAISIEDINTLYDGMVYFLRRFKEAIDPKSTKDVEEFILTEEATFFRSIQDALQFSDPDFQSASSIRGDGKRVYPYVNSSYGQDVLGYFVNRASLDKLSGGFFKPDFLKAPFFTKNIFVTGFSKIKSVIDHDSTKYKGLDNTAKMFKNETSLDWFARNFLYGFIGALEVKAEDDQSYYQFLDTPSNKPNTQAADVTLHSLEKAKEGIKLLREQEKLRQAHAIRNYTPDKSYIASDEDIKKGVDKFLDSLIGNNVLSLMNLDAIYSKLRKVVKKPDAAIEKRAKAILAELAEKSEKLETFLQTTQQFEEVTEEDQKVIEQVVDQINEEALEKLELNDIETLIAYYRPIAEIFYHNFYLNSHGLRQLVMGDTAFFKDGTEAYDIIKRMSITMAPGKVGAVNESLGFMESDIRVIVAEDLKRYIDDPEIQGLLADYDATDAQGFVTPDFAARVRRSYGFEEGLDVVMKPVHYEIDEQGISRAVKFSTIELTDELTDKYPGLKKVRQLMENNGAHIYTFPSAVKVGVPLEITKNDDTEYDVPSEINVNSIFTLKAKNFRIQLNPAHDAISDTANPGQLTFQGVINENNLSQVMRVNELNAAMIALGSKRIGKIFQLKGVHVTSGTTEVARNLAKSNWFDMAGFEGLWTLVNNPKINLNMPILQKAIERLIASKFTRESVGFRFLGSKLVLQADYGVTHTKDKNGKITKSKLKWKDDNSWTECYVPEAWRERYGLKAGDNISIKNGKIVAFRLPSTGLHSALVMQIKDFYPTPEGAKANVVIAPKEIVYHHGSDYDVDALFVLMKKKVKELFKVNEEGKFNLGAMLRTIDPNAADLIMDANDDIGESNDKPLLVDGLPLLDTLNDYIKKADDKLQDIFSKDPKSWTGTEREFVGMMNGNLGKDGVYHQLISLMQELIKNEIVDTFAEMLTDAENNYWMSLPITMKRLNDVTKEESDPSALDTVAELRGLEVQKKHKELYENVDLSDVSDQQKMHYNSYSGAQLVGVSANSYKNVAHIFLATKTTSWLDTRSKKVYLAEDLEKVHSSQSEAIKLMRKDGIFLVPKTKEAPTVKEGLEININGHTWSELSHKEKELVKDEEGNTSLQNKVTKLGPNAEGEYSTKTYTIWETFDSLINASIDNVKEQIVYLLNLTGQTANEYFAMLSFGIPMPTVVRFMNQPIIYELATQGTLNSENLKKLQNRLIKQLAKSEQVDVKEKASLKEFSKRVLGRQVNITDANMIEASQAYWLGGKDLMALTSDQMMVQIKVVEEFAKLSEIGSAMFDLSRTLNTLKSFPTTYWEQKEVLATMFDNISDFGQESTTTALKRQDAKTDETREKFEEAKSRSGLLASIADKELTEQEKIREANSSILSSVLSHGNNKYTVAHSKWPFPNASILSVPNVQQAIKVTQRLVHMQEQMFFRHSAAMNNFIGDVAKDLDLNAYAFRRKWKAYDKFKSDFMHFFLSGITLKFRNQDYKIVVDPSLQKVDHKDKGRKKFGFKAWSLQLIEDIRTLRKEYPNNPFLNAVEFGFNKEEKVTTIVFTSDKSKTAMENLVYKAGFKQLDNAEVRAWEKSKGINTEGVDTEFTDIQLRLLHYMLVTQGSEFGRTSFSMVIPDRMYEEYSRVFSEHMQKTLDRNGVSELLSRLQEQFTLQFVTNNIGLLPIIRGNDPRIATDVDYTQFDVHFGLALKHPEDKEYDAPEYVSYYGDAYIYIGNDQGLDLYQKVSYKSGVKYYSFPEKLIDGTFDIATVFNGTLILPRDQGYDKDKRIYTTLPNPKQIPKVGEEVYLHSTSDVSYTNTDVYIVEQVNSTESVNSKGEKEVVYTYKLKYDRLLDTSVNSEFVTKEEIKEQKVVNNPSYRTSNSAKVEWARFSPYGYEVSSKGDTRFSALFAKFAPGTVILGKDVSNSTIEHVYQSIVKKSGKGKPPTKDSIVFNEELSGAAAEDYSYEVGYKMLWQLWAEQNPLLIEDLKQKLKEQKKTVLTDRFAATRVSQARALADIINESNDISISEAPLEGVAEATQEAINKGIAEGDVTRASFAKAPALVSKIKYMLQEKGIALDELNNVYTSFDRTYKRLTEWTRDIFKDSFDKDIFTYRAEKDFEKRGVPLDGIYNDTSGNVPIPYTFEERVAFHKASINSGAAAGRAVHAYIEYWVEKDSKKREEIGEKFKKLGSEKRDEKGNITQQRISPHVTRWLTEDVIEKILLKSGININIKSKAITPGQDHLLTEVMSYSDSLGYATQVDGLVIHPNGDMSIVDWKTGKLFSDEFTNKVFKYAQGISASKINTAKLEVALRAFALKEMLGDEAKFRKLSLGLITKSKGVHMIDIELKDYLEIIENYIKATNPAQYQELKKKGMFSAANYLTDSSATIKFRTNVEEMDPVQQRDYIDKKLRSMSLSYSQEQINNNKDLRTQYTELTRVKLELEGREDLSYNDEDQDIAKYQRFFYNLKDMPSKFLKSFSTILFKRQKDKDDEYDQIEETFNQKLNAVLKEYIHSKPSLQLINSISRGTVNYLPFMGGLNKRELFAFMWDKKDSEGYHGAFANQMDYYYDAEGNKLELTTAQKEFRDFYHSSWRGKYEAVVGKEVYDANGKESTIAKEQGYDDKLDPIAMPRVPKNTSDMVEEVRDIKGGLKLIGIKVQESIAAIVEDPYTGDETGIPIRYHHASDSKVIQEELHSFDVERAWKAAMKDLINKDHMEDVYALAKGLKSYYATSTDRKGNPLLPKLNLFMEDVIFSHILERLPEERMGGKKFTTVITKKAAESWLGKQANLKEGTAITFQYETALMTLKHWTSALGMMFKPVSGVANGLLIFGTNTLRALSNSFTEISGTKTDFNLADMMWAHKAVLVDPIADLFSGKSNGLSKIHHIAKKARFLTDNYDYKALNDEMLTAKNTLFSSTWLYIFHSMFESYGQYTLLAAMMRKMKVTMPDGSESNMYDLHDNLGNYIGPVRGVVVDKLGIKTELKGLDFNEINRMKRVSEKLHGSYRKDERVMAELNIWGQIALQFKKYLPGLMKNNWRGTREEHFLGEYKIKVDADGVPIRPDGLDQYEWEEMQVTGRLPLLVGYIKQTYQKYSSPDSPFRQTNLTWAEMSSQQRQELVNVFQTMLVMLGGFLFVAGTDDEDKNTFKFKKTRRLLEDLTLGLNPSDLIRPLAEKPYATVTKVQELLDAFAELIGEGAVGELDSRGYPKGAYKLWKLTPIGSSAHAIQSFNKDLEDNMDKYLSLDR